MSTLLLRSDWLREMKFSIIKAVKRWNIQQTKFSDWSRRETFKYPLKRKFHARSWRRSNHTRLPRVSRNALPKKETCVTLRKTAAREISVSFALIKSINFLFSSSLVSLCHSTYTTILMILKMNLIIAHLTQTGTILSKHNYLSFGVKALKKLLSKLSRSLQKYASLFQQYLV